MYLALCTREAMHIYRCPDQANGCTREAVGALSMQMCSPAGGPQRQREGLWAGAAGGAHERRALELELRGSRRQEGIARGRRSALQRLHDQGSCSLHTCVCQLQVGLRMHVNFSMRSDAEAHMLFQSNMGVLHTTLCQYSQQVEGTSLTAFAKLSGVAASSSAARRGVVVHTMLAYPFRTCGSHTVSSPCEHHGCSLHTLEQTSTRAVAG